MRPMPILHALLLATLLGATPCGAGQSSEPVDITIGAWRGDGGPEDFVFQFDLGDTGLRGIVHTLGDGMKMTEMSIADVIYEPPRLQLRFAHGPVFEGDVDASGRRIDGAIYVNGEKSGEMPLEWVDPATIAVLDAGEGRYRDAPYEYRVPEASGWPAGRAAEAGVDEACLTALVRGVHAGEAGVLHALLVARGGDLVLEEYFHGCRGNTQHAIASVTKSVASLLVGIALDRREIAALDVPLVRFFPESPYAAGWEKATLEHLLTMSLGLDWNEQEVHGLHGTGPEFFKYVMSRGFAREPGTKWVYANADVNLLAGVIHEATGRQADQYAQEHLFGPLGITDWNWEYARTEGYPQMDGTLRLTARGLLAIGQMVLDGGQFGGRRVVSREWIEASTASQIETGEPEGYGYLWWRFHLPGPDGDTVTALVANGWGSQFIAVFPELDLVVVTLGGNQDNGKHLAVGKLLSQHLLPAVGDAAAR